MIANVWIGLGSGGPTATCSLTVLETAGVYSPLRTGYVPGQPSTELVEGHGALATQGVEGASVTSGNLAGATSTSASTRLGSRSLE